MHAFTPSPTAATQCEPAVGEHTVLQASSTGCVAHNLCTALLAPKEFCFALQTSLTHTQRYLSRTHLQGNHMPYIQLYRRPALRTNTRTPPPQRRLRQHSSQASWTETLLPAVSAASGAVQMPPEALLYHATPTHASRQVRLAEGVTQAESILAACRACL